MGEIADMMLDGTLCEQCGEFIGEGEGLPQLCGACATMGRTPTMSRTSVAPSELRLLQWAYFHRLGWLTGAQKVLSFFVRDSRFGHQFKSHCRYAEDYCALAIEELKEGYAKERDRLKTQRQGPRT